MYVLVVALYVDNRNDDEEIQFPLSLTRMRNDFDKQSTYGLMSMFGLLFSLSLFLIVLLSFHFSFGYLENSQAPARKAVKITRKENVDLDNDEFALIFYQRKQSS